MVDMSTAGTFHVTLTARGANDCHEGRQDRRGGLSSPGRTLGAVQGNRFDVRRQTCSISASTGRRGARRGARSRRAASCWEGVVSADLDGLAAAGRAGRARGAGGDRDDERRRLGRRAARGGGLAGAGRRLAEGRRWRRWRQDRQVDARVLAELARRDLVPASGCRRSRTARSRAAAAADAPVRLRTSANNRIFGILTQWGVRRRSPAAQADGLTLLERHGVPEVWRDSVRSCCGRSTTSTAARPARPRAAAARARDERATPADDDPRRRRLLALTLAGEIGDISRFRSAAQLVGYSGLVPRVKQSGQAHAPAGSPRPARRCCAGPRSKRPSTLGGRRTPGTGSTPTSAPPRQGNAAKSAVARKVLIACWHVLARNDRSSRRASRRRSCPGKLRQPLAA